LAESATIFRDPQKGVTIFRVNPRNIVTTSQACFTMASSNPFNVNKLNFNVATSALAHALPPLVVDQDSYSFSQSGRGQI
jgi:hypothetical protein